MTEDMLNLLEIQEIDLQVDEFRAKTRTVPDKIHKLKKELQDLEDEVNQLHEEIKKLEFERRRVEGNLNEKQSLLGMLKTRIELVKTNKEYTALQQEMADAQEKIDLLEIELLRILETIDQKKEALAAKSAQLTEDKAKKVIAIKELEEKHSVSKEEENAILRKRNKVAAKLSTQLINKYDRIRNARKDGKAVVSMVNNACGGCNRKLRPHQLQLLKECLDIIICENCGRMIICVNLSTK